MTRHKYTVAVLYCSIYRGAPSDHVAFERKTLACSRAEAAAKVVGAIRKDILPMVTDPTIKYLDVWVGRSNIPGEFPLRLWPFRLAVETGALMDGTHVIDRPDIRCACGHMSQWAESTPKGLACPACRDRMSQ